MTVALLLLALVAGLYMSWSIGANDVANAMGTSVGSRALTLTQAVCIAAVLEFCGAFFLGSYVTETIQSGLVDVSKFVSNPQDFALGMIAALFSAGIWLQVASYFGWPVSTTHTIVGSVIGFGILASGLEGIFWNNVLVILSSWVLSPFFGGLLSFLIFYFLREQIFSAPQPLEAAKRWTPFLVLFLTVICSLLLSLTGINQTAWFRSPWAPWFWGIGVGGVLAAVSWFSLQKMRDIQERSDLLPSPVAIQRGLEKAKRHLMRAQDASQGDMHYRLALVLSDVDQLQQQMMSAEEEIPSLHQVYDSVEKIFRYLQIVTAGMMAFAHGANDVANAIGPLSAAWQTLRHGELPIDGTIYPWLLVLGGVGIVIGLATWGWRVIETIGKKITELTPTRGFAAEFGAATTIVLASRLGMPISTTHTLVGSVVGVGFARGISAINLRIMKEILVSWLVTVPIGAGLSMALFLVFRFLFSSEF